MTAAISVDVPPPTTRSNIGEIPETDASYGSLSWEWAPEDRVYLTTLSGRYAGEMSLAEIDAEAAGKGYFSGNLAPSVTSSQDLLIYYVGHGNSYPSSVFAGGNLPLDFSAQDGSLSGGDAGVNRYDYLVGRTHVTVESDVATVDDFKMERLMSVVRVQLNPLDENGEAVEASLREVTISGLPASATLSLASGELTPVDGEITVAAGGNDLFIATAPCSMQTLSFAATDADGKSYTGKLELSAPFEIEANIYVRYMDADGKIAGLPVSVTRESGASEGPELVGPVYTYEGKQYRLAAGNLYYNTKTKEWGIFERQTDMLSAQGCTYLKVSTNNSPEVIDLFSWGCTGIDNALSPELFANGWAGETSFASSNFPSTNTNTMDVNGNASITDLWKFDRKYDFGYAYMQNGRPAGDDRDYRMVPLEYFADYLCDQSKSFSQGCVVKGAGQNGADVKGALIIPGITTVAEATGKIQAVGGTVKSLTKLNPNSNNTGFDFTKITLPDYEAIGKLNAVFLPAAGCGTFISGSRTSPAKPGLAKDQARYWSKDGANGSSITANAYGLYFRKSSTAAEFNWKTNTNGVSIARNQRSCVRLMVEVK